MGVDLPCHGEEKSFGEALARVSFDAEALVELQAAIRSDVERSPGDKPVDHLAGLADLQPGPAVDILMHLAASLRGPGSSGSPAGLLGIKELWIEEFLQPLHEACEFRGIHMIRDPRAVFASRNYGSYRDRHNQDRYPILFIANAWKRSVHYAQRHVARAEITRLRYEDLVTDPEGTLIPLCAHLGVAYDERMLDSRLYRNGVGEIWKTNSSFFSGERGVHAGAVDKWRKLVRDEEAGLLEYLCADEMDFMGYERAVPEFGQTEFEDYQEAEESITPWLRRAPFLLTAEAKNEILKERG